MSHFTVLVVGEDIEKQLAPFQENNMGDCPKEYLKFFAYPKESMDERWFDSEEAAKKELGELYDDENSGLENPNRKWDRYEAGGRRAGSIKVKESCKGKYESPGFSRQTDPNSANSLMDGLHTDSAILQDIENIEEISCFAILHNGNRYEKGSMGPRAIVTNQKMTNEEWNLKTTEFIKSLDTETRITIVDCHI